MARLYLFAEGRTEQTFADTVLRPHLAEFGVYLHPPILVAHARKKGLVHRGGGRKYVPMRNDILRFLAQEKTFDVFFTTMIDLYAIPVEFPCLEQAESLRHLPERRVAFLEESFANDINDVRFLPYLQLHEFEACLLAGPEWFAYFYEGHAKQIAALQSLAGAYASPEQINDGPHTAPSKRIIAQFPDYEDAKAAIGPQIGELIGLDTIRKRCPHFASWLSRLESLGGVA